MIAVDTSVVVAAFATWHEGHEVALDALLQRPRLPVHVAVETYSVITRLPPPHRAPAGVVRDFLDQRFPEPWLTLPDSEVRVLIGALAEAEITGGAVYDAIIARTAGHWGALLLTRDRRAARVYEAVGVEFRVVA